MKPPALPTELHFTEQEIDDDPGSLLLFWASAPSSTGIYWLTFTDGTGYVGQSVAARTRLAAHRRRWPDTVRVRFAPCSREHLDEMERATIRHAETVQELRNKLLTNRPGGNSDLKVTVSPGQSFSLPWDRAKRGSIGPAVRPPEAAPEEAANYALLRHVANYHEIEGAAASLVAGAIPSPRVSQSLLWSVSAVPSTNRSSEFRRLLAVSTGRLEILRIFEEEYKGRHFNPGFLNVSPEAAPERLVQSLRRAGLSRDDLMRGDYRVVSGVQTLHAPSPEYLHRLLSDPFILDTVYQLVVTMMRQGSAPLGRFHNRLLAEAVLTRAWETNAGPHDSRIAERRPKRWVRSSAQSPTGRAGGR